MKYIPSLCTLSGVLVMILAASSDDASLLSGNRSPDWMSWVICAGVALVGIGVFLLKTQGARRK